MRSMEEVRARGNHRLAGDGTGSWGHYIASDLLLSQLPTLFALLGPPGPLPFLGVAWDGP